MTKRIDSNQARIAVIIANALVSAPRLLLRWTRAATLIIAADGGCRHCRGLGIVPNVLVGDLDSTTEEDLIAFREQGVEVLRYPPRKDQTDLELALDLALERDADQIVVFGALGLRWDMTLGNLMILTKVRSSQASIKLLDGPTEIGLVRGGDRVMIVDRLGAQVSLIPAGQAVRGVTLEGFEYPLFNRDLEAGSTLGISNIVRRESATIEVHAGLLFCVVTNPDGSDCAPPAR